MRCTDCRKRVNDNSGRKYGRCDGCRALGELLLELHRPPPRLSAAGKVAWRLSRVQRTDRRHNGEAM